MKTTFNSDSLVYKKLLRNREARTQHTTLRLFILHIRKKRFSSRLPFWELEGKPSWHFQVTIQTWWCWISFPQLSDFFCEFDLKVCLMCEKRCFKLLGSITNVLYIYINIVARRP